MSKKAALPIALVAFGIFAITHSVGCSGGSSGGAGGSGAGGKTDGGTGGMGTGGRTDGGTGGMGTGGRTDGGTGGMGTGGRIDGGTDAGTGGMGTGGRIDAGPDADAAVDSHPDAVDAPADVPADVPTDVPAPTDTGTDVAPETAPFIDAGATPLEKAATLCPMFPSTTTNSMFPSDFCAIYVALCTTGRDAASPDMASCLARYTASQHMSIATNGSIGACESYHICNAYNAGAPTTATEATHCPHAEGLAICL